MNYLKNNFDAHGFTAGKNGRLGAPEWHLQNRIDLDDGAELWEVYSDGTEVLRGKFVKDAVVTEKHFLSSAYNVDDFIKSSRQREFEYILKIEGKNGKLIEPASTLPEEAEVLFKSGTRFKVEKASYDLHPDDSYLNSQGQPLIWTVILKEL